MGAKEPSKRLIAEKRAMGNKIAKILKSSLVLQELSWLGLHANDFYRTRAQ